MGLFDRADSLRQSLTPYIEKVINEKTRECLRTYKAKVVTPPNSATGKCEVQLVGQETTLSLPYSTEASGVTKGQMVWVATTLNSFRNGVVLNSIDFKGSKRIGDIYISADDISPASIFGGKWTKITGKFLLASSSNYGVGTNGGSLKIAKENLPDIKGEILTNSNGGALGIIDSNNSGVFTPDYPTTTAAYATGTYSSGQGYRGLKFNLGGKGNDYLPPYLSVNVWKRIKGADD